jgi:prepilin-type N-terminal cleavage/methylation domain-containing protein
MASAKLLRRGLSLMEVILAIAILGGALATIGELIRIGARNAAITRDLTTAQLYCESKMNEAASGVIDLENLETETLDEEGEWMCVITTEALDQQQLIAVTVTVGQNPDEFARPVSFSMTRWIIDPAYVAECAALDAKLKAEAKQRVANAAQTAGSTGDAGGAATASGPTSGTQAGGGFGAIGGGVVGGAAGQGGFGGGPGGQGGRGGQGGLSGGGPGGGGDTNDPRNRQDNPNPDRPIRPITDKPQIRPRP